MSFKITILGSSGALPAFGRFPSSQVVEIQNRHFMIDCGEGAQMQLMKYQANLHRISNIFISHLHGDHYLGLMGLMFTMHLLRRTNDLHIHSHAGLDEILTAQLRHSRSALNYKVFFHRLTPELNEIIYEDEVLTIETIPLVHKLPCSGFLFREKIKPRRVNKETLPSGLRIQQIAELKKGIDVTDDGGNVLYKNEMLTYAPRHSRSYAYCSDTAYHEKLIEQIRDIDVLYHEATFTMDEQQKAFETKHSTARQAALIARSAQVKKLLIGHFSARYRDLAPVLEEAKSVFENTELAIEGETFSLSE
jgi:ribonuclease Z